jgi:hypothetical protein
MSLVNTNFQSGDKDLSQIFLQCASSISKFIYISEIFTYKNVQVQTGSVDAISTIIGNDTFNTEPLFVIATISNNVNYLFVTVTGWLFDNNNNTVLINTKLCTYGSGGSGNPQDVDLKFLLFF